MPTCITLPDIVKNREYSQDQYFSECDLIIANKYNLLCIPFAEQHDKFVVNLSCFPSAQFDFTAVWFIFSYVVFKSSFYFFDQHVIYV